MIIGCDFCHEHIKAIGPRKQEVELANGTTVQIIQKPDKRPPDTVPLPKEKEYVPEEGRPTNKIKVTKPITVKPESQTSVTVSTERSDLILIDPLRKLCENHDCLAATGVHQVQPEKEFHILVANFSKKPVKLIKDQ